MEKSLNLENEKSKFSLSDSFKKAIYKNYKFFSKHYFLSYTILFAIICLIIFMPFIAHNKTFVWFSDGWQQHYKALTYYGTWLRSIVKGVIFDHQFTVPMWNFSLGQGGDVIDTLNYYVIGDPLNLLSVFVPAAKTYYLYDALIIVRLFLSGFCFSLFCFDRKCQNKFAVLTGSLIYTFCGFTLLASIRHPYFTNPMIYLPLMLIGVEKIFEKKRSLLFTFTVCIASMSNFYFFYMLVLVVVIYTAIRLITMCKKDFRKIVGHVIHLFIYALIGVLLSAVIFLPVLTTFLSDGRNAVAHPTDLFYNLTYYTSFPSTLFSSEKMGQNWTCLAYSAVIIPCLVLLFENRRKNKSIKIFLLLGTLFLMSPIAGKIFNGFSYAANRWCFAFSFLIAYMAVTTLPDLVNIRDKKQLIHIVIATAIYEGLCFISSKSRSTNIFLSISIVLILVLYIFYNLDKKSNQKNLKIATLFTAIISIIANSVFLYSYNETGYVSEFLDEKEVINRSEESFDNVVIDYKKKNNDTEFSRFAGSTVRRSENSSLIKGTNSCQFYWSLSNPNIFQFRNEMNVSESMPQSYHGFDDRTAAMTLSSVKYYALSQGEKNHLPYGYEGAAKSYVTTYGNDGEEEIDCYLYENKYALPIGYTYDKYISREAYEKMNAIEKQEALLQGMLIDEKISGKSEADPEFTSKNISYVMDLSDGIKQTKENTFLVTKKNESITLNFNGLNNSETYIGFKNFDFKGFSQYDLYNDSSLKAFDDDSEFEWDNISENKKYSIEYNKKYWVEPKEVNISLKSSSGNSRKFLHYTPYYSWYSGRQDYDINMGYKKDSINSITITFPEMGIYSFDDLNIICQPMDKYEGQINSLKSDVLENVSIDTNVVTGEIDLDSDKFLCLSIPYTKGWTAYVDGNKQELLRANTMYMGLELSPGNHQIRLEYSTPYLKPGAVISLVTLAGIMVYCIILLRKKRKN